MPGVDSNNATKNDEPEDDTTTKCPEEITQTDRLNKRLLMSYLQRINEMHRHPEQDPDSTQSIEDWNTNASEEDS